MIKVLDEGYVKIIETYGSDERIIEAARMSTDKGFQGWGIPCACRGAFHTGHTTGKCSLEGDEKLLRYLWTHKHMTPFEMAGAVFEIQAPIFVFREWQRHRTQSYNELSARYTELPDLFYIPSIDRLRAGGQSSANKQGSGTILDNAAAEQALLEIRRAHLETRTRYERLLALGLSRELARGVVPVNQYSRMRASANLRNWTAFLTLRLDPGAQWEIRQFAHAVHSLLSPVYPRTMGLFDEGLG